MTYATNKWMLLFESKDLFLEGLLKTIEVAILALLVALVIGILLSIMSSFKSTILKGIARAYVEFYQNTPLVVQIFFLYNGLPMLGIKISTFMIGVIGVGMYHGAYICEVIRGGIEAIPQGQFEAAKSQGFSYLQTMRLIIIPQTIRIILPAFTNQAVNLIKNTSVLAIIAGGELMYVTDSWSASTLNYAPAYIFAGILYFIICYPLARLATYYETYLDKKYNIRVSVDRMMEDN